jgi:hypothetical protein
MGMSLGGSGLVAEKEGVFDAGESAAAGEGDAAGCHGLTVGCRGLSAGGGAAMAKGSASTTGVLVGTKR